MAPTNGSRLPLPAIGCHHHRDFDGLALLAAKRALSYRLIVCIPARDEAATIGDIVNCIKKSLPVGLVDEIVVVDDGSCDATAVVAASAGATVLAGPGLGKGEAMRMALGRDADIVVFLDGDVRDFGAHFVTGLVGPLLAGEDVMLVKATYARPMGDCSSGGGRVTELVAKPLISLLFPDLVALSQPLAGETAVRRAVLDKVELDARYGVEMGLLLDVATLWGPSAIAQVDLGSRRHRNRPLEELAPQARQVMAAALARCNVVPAGS